MVFEAACFEACGGYQGTTSCRTLAFPAIAGANTETARSPENQSPSAKWGDFSGGVESSSQYIVLRAGGLAVDQPLAVFIATL